MAVRVISTSLASALTTQIKAFLEQESWKLEELRKDLCRETQDRWVCVSGTNFSYVVS